MRIREITALRASAETVTLYHGTCPDSAKALIAKGWEPHSGQQGANMGQSRYLYLTSSPEDAVWFAREKGCDTVIQVRNVPISMLRVDPEDGTYDTVEQELALHNGLPGKVVLTRALGPEHFALYAGKMFESMENEDRTFYHVTLTENLPAIMEKGLIPSVGDRSKKLKEPSCVFLFPTRDDAEQAVGNWLGDEFDDDTPLALIEVTLPVEIEVTKTADIDWEFYTRQVIPPECLRILARDF